MGNETTRPDARSRHDPVKRENRPLSTIFGGRRRSDRWAAYSFLLLTMLMSVFVLYTSYQQHTTEVSRDEAERQRTEILNAVEKQNRELLCSADNTQAFQIAIAAYVTELRTTPSGTIAPSDASRRLDAIRTQLQDAKERCFDGATTTTTR